MQVAIIDPPRWMLYTERGALHIAPGSSKQPLVARLKEAGWDIKPTTVTNLIRTRLGKNSVGMAVDLVNPSPDISAPLSAFCQTTTCK